MRRVDGPKAGQTLSDLMDYTKGKLDGIDMVKKFKSTLKQKFLDFVKRLGEADVRVEFHLWPGVYHGAEIFAPDASISKTIMATRLAGIKRLVELISR